MPIKRADDNSQSPRRHRQGSKRFTLLPWQDYNCHCEGQSRHDHYKRHSNLQTIQSNSSNLIPHDTSFLKASKLILDGDVELNPGPTQNTKSPRGRPKNKKCFRGTPNKAHNDIIIPFRENKPLGLKNRGQNVCFFNSVIQSLCTINSFREFVKALDTNKASTLAIKNLFSRIESSESPIETYEFIKSIILPGYDYTQREQFDAQECINHILNHVYQVDVNEIPEESSFRLSFLESLLCHNCHNPSEHTEYYNMCRIQFPNPYNPENSVKSFIEKLTSDPYGELIRDYLCSNCQTRTNARKSTTLFNVSDALIAQLVIFRYDQSTGVMRKLVPNITIETEIENVLLGTLKLHAIIYHHGDTPNSGHYTAAVKYGEQWYSVNDEIVMPIETDNLTANLAIK